VAPPSRPSHPPNPPTLPPARVTLPSSLTLCGGVRQSQRNALAVQDSCCLRAHEPGPVVQHLAARHIWGGSWGAGVWARVPADMPLPAVRRGTGDPRAGQKHGAGRVREKEVTGTTVSAAPHTLRTIMHRKIRSPRRWGRSPGAEGGRQVCYRRRSIAAGRAISGAAPERGHLGVGEASNNKILASDSTPRLFYGCSCRRRGRGIPSGFAGSGRAGTDDEARGAVVWAGEGRGGGAWVQGGGTLK